MMMTICSSELGVLSYDVVYPASRAEYWKELYATVNGILVEDVPRPYLSEVPWMIEAYGCGGLGGRNVLFADGRAEFMLDEDWHAVLGTYLLYAYE